MIPIPTKKKLIVLVMSIIFFIFAGQTTFSEKKGNSRLRLSLKLAAGPGYIRVGDINNHIQSFDDYMSASLVFYQGGKMERISNYIPHFEGELRIDFNPKLAIAVGTGYISGSKSSDFQTAGIFPFSSTRWDPALFEYIIEPEIKAIPLKVGIYYSIPLTSNIDFLMQGGIGYYFSKAYLLKKNIIRSLYEFSIPEYPQIVNEYEVSGSSPGLHGGIGLEYKLTNAFFLVIDVQGRYAKITKLSGTRAHFNTWNSDQNQDNGILYIGTRNLTDEGYGDNCPDLLISPSLNMDKASLDLSGFYLTIGLKIRLF
jgi:hypothetical protein